MRLLLALFFSFWLAMTSASASDWEEDRQPVQASPAASAGHGDTVILDDNSGAGKQHSSNGMLQGSATAVRTHTPPPRPYITQAQIIERLQAAQRIDAGASRFLLSAPASAITPPAVFKDFIRKNHPDFQLDAQKNGAATILVVRGQWDDSSKPLKSFGLKCDQVKTRELSEAPLDRFKVLIIDCAGLVRPDSVEKIRLFVERGGYLLTTDWSLQNVLEAAFPGFIQWNGDNTDGVTTDAFIMEPDSPLIAGLSGRRYTWKLDRMSQCVRILSPGKVHMLARSSRLSQGDPQLHVIGDPFLAGGLALEFSYGKGKVLHLVGHFDNCSNSFHPFLLPDPTPEAGISLRQVLSANFILEALKNAGGGSDSAAAQ